MITIYTAGKARIDQDHYPTIDAAEAALVQAGLQPRERQPGEWVLLSPRGNQFASVRDDEGRAAYRLVAPVAEQPVAGTYYTVRGYVFPTRAAAERFAAGVTQITTIQA